jgi:hypothetical protein
LEGLKLVLWVQASITIGGGVKASFAPIKLALAPPPMVIEAWTHKIRFNPSSNGY